MNTNAQCVKSNLEIAETYYESMLKQEFETMAQCLHTDVCLFSPAQELSGKENVVQAAKELSQICTNIDIRSKFSHQNQVMLAYDFTFPNPTGQLLAAALITFKDNLIAKIELFFDTSSFHRA